MKPEDIRRAAQSAADCCRFAGGDGIRQAVERLARLTGGVLPPAVAAAFKPIRLALASGRSAGADELHALGHALESAFALPPALPPVRTTVVAELPPAVDEPNLDTKDPTRHDDGPTDSGTDSAPETDQD